MTTPPDDRSFRREMATAYRSGWHFIDLVTAIPHSGDSLMVTVFGEPVVVTRDEDEDVRAYRCLRRPRGAPQPVRLRREGERDGQDGEQGPRPLRRRRSRPQGLL
ncbi:hypothetical protein, partial [Streptomyces coeruleorubidus]|uniref:hypothetical protein n=1 Tax=Streptomyces coeruleorubidus TaxID=116188 RepID=UPI0033BD0D84